MGANSEFQHDNARPTRLTSPGIFWHRTISECCHDRPRAQLLTPLNTFGTFLNVRWGIVMLHPRHLMPGSPRRVAHNSSSWHPEVDSKCSTTVRGSDQEARKTNQMLKFHLWCIFLVK
jgi:hypothetical protein